jgi:hypothetical protein
MNNLIKRFFIYFSLIPVLLIHSSIESTGYKNPAEYLADDTLLYFEVLPAKITIPRLKKMFFSLMDSQKALTEWDTFGEIFTEEFGINLLSAEQLESNSFNMDNPVGIAVNYSAYKNKHITNYQRKLTWLFPSVNPEKSFSFFKNHLLKESENKTFQIQEIKNNHMIRFNKGQIIYIIMKIDNYIVYSNDEKVINEYQSIRYKNLAQSENFLAFKKYHLEKKLSNDEVLFFFINSEESKSPFRENPRLLLDNILMDNILIKELARNSIYIGGFFHATSNDIKITIQYFFPDKFLDDKNTFLGEFLNYNSTDVFTDSISHLPFAYARWQSNFSGKTQNTTEKNFTSRKNIEKTLRNLLDDKTIEIPDNFEYLIKDNVSLYIEDVPRFNLINKYYLWKGYLTFTYDNNYLNSFNEFMKKLSEDAEKNNQDFSINKIKIPGKNLWEIQVKKIIKKYDRQKDEVIEELKIYPFFILVETNSITLTHDPGIQHIKPSIDNKTIIQKTDLNSKNKDNIIFAFLDITRLNKYFKESSFAVSFLNYLSYLEKAKYALFKVTRTNNTIMKEMIVKLDR